MLLGENIKYVCKLTNEGMYTIADNKSRHVKHLSVKFGNDYYLKAYVPFHSALGALFTHSQMQTVGTMQGSLECDLIKNAKNVNIKE